MTTVPAYLGHRMLSFKTWTAPDQLGQAGYPMECSHSHGTLARALDLAWAPVRGQGLRDGCVPTAHRPLWPLFRVLSLSSFPLISLLGGHSQLCWTPPARLVIPGGAVCADPGRGPGEPASCFRGVGVPQGKGAAHCQFAKRPLL